MDTDGSPVSAGSRLTMPPSLSAEDNSEMLPPSDATSTQLEEEPKAQLQLHPNTPPERDDGQTSDDPLGPHPAYFEGGYHILPQLTYFTLSNPAATAEFENTLQGPVSASLLQKGYSQFCVSYTHVGYDTHTAVPCLLVVAREFDVRHARELVEMVRGMGCQYTRRTICFNDTYKKIREGVLKGFPGARAREYAESPEMGASLGAAQEGGDSFSVGCYLHLDGDWKTTYCLSVPEGVTPSLPLGTSGITGGTSPTAASIAIQQPSSSDQIALIENLRNTLHMIDKKEPQVKLRSRNATEKWLQETLLKDTTFGTLRYSEAAVVSFDGKDITSKWCLIEVNESRDSHLSNSFQYHTNDPTAWIPRTCAGRIYVQGTATLEMGNRVIKNARSTGCTVGDISMTYAHTKTAEGIPPTREFSVLSGSQGRFSESGESGAPVIDEANRIVGMLLGSLRGEPLLLEGHEQVDSVHVSFVTPMEFVVRRIEGVTGKKVSVDVVDVQKLKDEGVKFVGHGME